MKSFLMLVGSFLIVFGLHAQGVPDTLFSPNAENGGNFGTAISTVKDLNNDGVDEIIVGAHREEPDGSPNNLGRAYVFDGATGDTLFGLKSPNEQQNGFFGSAVADGGDLNNDQISEVLVSAPFETVNGATSAGRVYAFSGANGDSVTAFEAPIPSVQANFGHEIRRIGDLNNDSISEIAISAIGENSDAGKVYIFDGATGDTLRTLCSPSPITAGFFGYSIANGGDINGDSVPDQIIGAFNEQGSPGVSSGKVYAFDGATGDTLYSVGSPNPQDFGSFGTSVANIGDVDNDSTADFVVGASGEGSQNLSSSGRAYVFSGATGDTLFGLKSPNEQVSGFFGISVNGLGDVNGDSVGDIGVGTLFEAFGGAISGSAYVFSGANGDTLFGFQGPFPESEFGYKIVGKIDKDGDGDQEILVSAPAQIGGGAVYCFNPSQNATAIDPDLVHFIPSMRLYPNPGRGQVELEFEVEKAGIVQIDLINQWGQTIQNVGKQSYPAGVHQLAFDTSKWPAGYYYCRLSVPQAQTSGSMTLLVMP